MRLSKILFSILFLTLLNVQFAHAQTSILRDIQIAPFVQKMKDVAAQGNQTAAVVSGFVEDLSTRIYCSLNTFFGGDVCDTQETTLVASTTPDTSNTQDTQKTFLRNQTNSTPQSNTIINTIEETVSPIKQTIVAGISAAFFENRLRQLKQELLNELSGQQTVVYRSSGSSSNSGGVSINTFEKQVDRIYDSIHESIDDIDSLNNVTSFTNSGVTNINGTLLFDGSAGTAGQLLISNGTGTTPTWENPSNVSVGNANTLDTLDSLDFLQTANNLSDLTSSSTARTNLGLGALATLSDISSFGVNYSGGNVGIGTTTPSSKLAVAGDINLTGKLNVNGTQALYIPGGDFAGTMYLGNGGGSLLHTSGNQGQFNTFVGIDSGLSNTTGSNNTANGYQSLNSNTTGSYNTASGYQSLYSNEGSWNTANGYQSLYSNTTGSYNTANGYQSLYSNTTGSYNTANGYQSLFSNTTGSSNTANGIQSLNSNTTGYQNTAVGKESLYQNTEGFNNTANGFESLYSNTTGSWNTANGIASLRSNTTGSQNTASGSYSLRFNTEGSNNTANGYQSLNSNTTGSYLTANGYQSLYSNTTASNNTASGYQSLRSNTTGTNNTANGYQSLVSNTTGTNNTANGYQSLYSNTTGAYNTALGYQSGRYIANGSSANASSSNSIFLGALTKASANGVDNETVIGYNATGIGSNTVVLGNDSVLTTALKGNVGIGTTTPTEALSIAGNINLTGALKSNGSAGTLGYVLQTTGTGIQWVATSTLGFGTGNGTVTSVDMSVPTGLTISGNPITTNGTLALGLDPLYNIPLTASTTAWENKVGYTDTLARNAFSSTATGLTYTSGTGVFSLTSGYEIPTTASTSAWNNKVESQWTTSGLDIYYNTGNVGIGTTTPNSKLSVAGDMNLTGALKSNGSAGTLGYLLQTTGTGVQWVATSTLGIGGGTDVNALSIINVGDSNTATTTAISMGYKNSASTTNSTLFGNQNFTSTGGNASVALGILNNSSGATLNTSTGVITGTISATTTVGALSTSVGILNTAKAQLSTAIGYKNVAAGLYSTVVGYSNTLSTAADYAAIFGSSNTVTTTGVDGGVVAVGYANAVSALSAGAFGTANTVAGNSSNAFGKSNTITGGSSSAYSGAYGYNNTVTSSSGAFAFGYGNQISSSSGGAFIFGNGITNAIANSLMIGPSNTAKITILSTGNVGIGTTTPTEKLTVVGSAQFTTVLSGTFGSDLNLTADGTLTKSVSDERLKTNITRLDSVATLDKIMQLQASSFDWKSNGSHDIGLIAQEVELIFPELVFTNQADGYKGINYSRIPALLIAAVQELAYKIAQLAHLVKTERVETETLCVGKTCVTEDQLKSLLENQGISPAPAPSPTTPDTNTTPTGDATTTPATSDTTTVTEPPVAPVEPPVAEPLPPEPAPEVAPEPTPSEPVI